MSKFYLINDQRVNESLDMYSVIQKVEDVYKLKAQKQTKLFPVITHDWIVGKKDMDIKSGLIGGEIDVYGLKALTYMESNDQENLPRLTGTMMLFDSTNGQLKGILDSRSITGLRTGAAGGIGAKYLARKDSKTLLIIGSGNQAFYNLAATLMVMDQIEEVYVYDPVQVESAIKFVETVEKRLQNEILNKYDQADQANAFEENFKVTYSAIEDLETYTKKADIIVTVTPSRKPLIMKSWVKKGTHINCIGSDMEGKQEIDEMLFKDAVVVVDDMHQATSIGETETAIKTGLISEDDIRSEMGGIILNTSIGRSSDEEITIFDTTGLALQDLVVASHLLDQAEKDNLRTYEL